MRFLELLKTGDDHHAHNHPHMSPVPPLFSFAFLPQTNALFELAAHPERRDGRPRACRGRQPDRSFAGICLLDPRAALLVGGAGHRGGGPASGQAAAGARRGCERGWLEYFTPEGAVESWTGMRAASASSMPAKTRTCAQTLTSRCPCPPAASMWSSTTT